MSDFDRNLKKYLTEASNKTLRVDFADQVMTNIYKEQLHLRKANNRTQFFLSLSFYRYVLFSLLFLFPVFASTATFA